MSEDVKKKPGRIPTLSMMKKMKSGTLEAEDLESFPKNNRWAFNAGKTFAGNPKYLFIYINKYRKDIDAYWLCDKEETVEYIRKLGYKAYTFVDREAHRLETQTGVYVVEQVKENIPERMAEVKYLNLYHGVGCKSIERRAHTGFLTERVAGKYIRYNQFYYDRQLFLVTSPLMEKHFIYQCGLRNDRVIRGGYPRCMYQKYFEKVTTFNHDIRGRKGLEMDTRIAAYVPTFRDDAPQGFMSLAIPDMERLIQKLEEKNMLMIFKMHPLIEEDYEYLKLKEKYQNHPRLLFWNNQEDFYEIFDDIEVGIIDYSSIFYDMLAGGTKYFIRYFFAESSRDMVYDLEEMTCGKMCRNFDALLEALDSYQEDDKQDRERIEKLFWEYDHKGSMDEIINHTLEFEPEPKPLPVLYTFDIFDTLISRKVLEPEGIFYQVKERMEASQLAFPSFFQENYPQKRKEAETNVREWYRKTLELRPDARREIHFEEIFERMAKVYHLTGEQKNALMQWELEAEYESAIPIPRAVSYVKDLMQKGETVCLISDMYLSREFIQKLLAKADPALGELPLFLSSEYGVQKSTGLLYLEVYKSFETYMFGAWIHHGDNRKADGTFARKLNITTVLRERPEFNEYEWKIASEIGTGDAFKTAALLARFRESNGKQKDYYAYGHISMYFVPYISWVLKHAIEHKTKCLYFISRDGYQLKRIADRIIEKKNLPIRTKYIYGSRRAWRIPSLITELDKEFFSKFGNFVNVKSYDKMLNALNMEENDFQRIFPDLAYLKDVGEITKEIRESLIITFSNSEPYRQYILDKSARDREIVLEYLRQEINFDERFSFVEYWGRGYTQDCTARLLEAACKEKCPVPFYYMRSIYSSEENRIRYNFTTASNSLIFVEAVFANIPYKSVEGYQRGENGKILPALEPADCDMELFHAMEQRLLQFVDDFYGLGLEDTDNLEKMLQKISVEYFEEHQEDEVFTRCLAPLMDSYTMYDAKREYAPAFTDEMADGLIRENPKSDYTSSLEMSLARSEKRLADKVRYIVEDVPELRREGDKKTAKILARKEENLLAPYKLQRHKWKSLYFQATYQKHALHPIEKGKVILFTNDSPADRDEYWSLEQEWKKMGNLRILRYKKNTFYGKVIKEMATAEYIFINRHIELMSLLRFRTGTYVVQLGEYAFSLDCFGKGMQFPGYLKDSRDWNDRLMRNDYDLICAASEDMKNIYETSFSVRRKGTVQAVGSCCTDIYFSEKFRDEARKSLEELFPAARGKKIIVYLPQYRHRVKGCRVLEFLDIRKLQKALGTEYVMVTDYRVPAGMDSYLMSEDLRDFFCDATNQISIRRLIAAGDVFVGDYRNTFFEAFLRRKPVFLTADDYEEYTRERDYNFAYKDIISAPVIGDAEELIWQLHHLETYDYRYLEQFCEKYLGACDGHAAERVLKLKGKQ